MGMGKILFRVPWQIVKHVFARVLRAHAELSVDANITGISVTEDSYLCCVVP